MARPVKRRYSSRAHCPTKVDIWGQRWRVGERRPTDYGFAIYMGWLDQPDGRQQGGKAAVIVTKALETHFRKNIQRPNHLPLPIGDNARRRVRQALGVDHVAWTDRRLAWWIDRLDDLGTLSAVKFAAKHGAKAWTRNATLSPTLVCHMRLALLGRQRRPIGWWKSRNVQKLVQGNLPMHTIAKRLQITPWMVYGARQRMRQLGLMS